MADADPNAGDHGKGGDAGGSKADDKPAVSFRTEGEFLAAVQKKTRKAVDDAIAATKTELFGALGIESADDLPGLAERLKTTEKTVSEHDKLKAAHDKLTKEFAKEQKKTGDLSGRLIKIAKRDALLPFVGQVVDPEVFTDIMDRQLEVDEDGAVTVKSGQKLEDAVADLLKSKAYLKKPDAAQGAGSSAKEPLKPKDGKDDDKSTKSNDGTKNGAAPAKHTFGDLVVAQLKAKGQLPNVGP